MAKAPKQNQQVRVGLILVGILMLFLIFQMMVQKDESGERVATSEFYAALDLPADSTERITQVTFKQNDVTAVRADGSTLKTYYNDDPKLPELLTEKGIKFNYEKPEEAGWLKTILINSLPMLLLLVLFILFMRQLQIGGGKAMSFGKSRAKLLNENQAKITFKDVAGVEEAKDELEEIIDFLKDPKKFTRLGGRIPKGVLLVGSPGTGKTILAKAIAGEAGVPFFSISGSDFVEMFVGVGASRVRDLFEQAKKHAPCIVFIDEIDAVGRHRGAGLGGGHDEREQTLNQLLVEMDGFESNEGVIIIAATNRPDVLDPALLRPGRFDRRVTVPKPDVKGRIGILKVHTRKKPLRAEVNLAKVAQGTPGFSGADLENLVNEAALIAARKNCDEVTMDHLELAKDKVLMGPERRSMLMSEDEKRNTSYHEAGHALVGLMTPELDPVHKVSIIPRGQALGVTILLPEEDRLTITKEYAEGMIAYAMGGRAAEELVFGRQTTGASDDINKATDIARKMVCSWGMSEKLGPLSLSKQNDEVFLGRELSQSKNYSEKVAEEIDKEVHRIVTTAYKKAYDLLKDNQKQLADVSETLLIKETLSAQEMQRIINGEDVLTEEDRENYANRLRPEQFKKQAIAEEEAAAQARAKAGSKDDQGPSGEDNPTVSTDPVSQAT